MCTNTKKTNLWSQGLTSLRKFCFATDSQIEFEDHPNSLEIIQRTFYMNYMVAVFLRRRHIFHYLQGCHNYSEKKYIQADKTKWCSNSREFCQQMQHDFWKPVEDLFSKRFHQRELGVHWSLIEDKIKFIAKNKRTLDRKTGTGHNASFCLLCQISTIFWGSCFLSSSEPRFYCKNTKPSVQTLEKTS